MSLLLEKIIKGSGCSSTFDKCVPEKLARTTRKWQSQSDIKVWGSKRSGSTNQCSSANSDQLGLFTTINIDRLKFARVGDSALHNCSRLKFNLALLPEDTYASRKGLQLHLPAMTSNKDDVSSLEQNPLGTGTASNKITISRSTLQAIDFFQAPKASPLP